MVYRKYININSGSRLLALSVGVLVLLLAGCQETQEEPEQATEIVAPTVAPAQEIAVEDEAYPGPLGQSNGETAYPEPVDSREDQYLAEPPDPERELPDPLGEAGVVGGALIQEVLGEGYIPLFPLKFMLGEVLLTDSGEPAYIRTGTDSPSAELLPSGVFIFHSVEPGDYGLVVDLGFTQFTIQNEDGTPRIIAVEPGMVLDLGLVITGIPGQ
ncbi:MAG: hypothetical protein JSW55_04350 [Chloroflexota bacterium]|nr:MAG: hypothetical protein JSW55_04350 [Chloroflexota bacterium]